MSYIGSKRSSSLTSINNADVTVSGMQQRKVIGENITVPSSQNLIFFGNTEFSGTINVDGELIVAGGSPDFQSDVNITGTLYAY
tara:strand:- start:105 stop:356 length:252 start_codon:yes stop_codon:yes gene_type:complete